MCETFSLSTQKRVSVGLTVNGETAKTLAVNRKKRQFIPSTIEESSYNSAIKRKKKLAIHFN